MLKELGKFCTSPLDGVWLREMDLHRKAMESVSGMGAMREFVESQTRWQAEMEKFSKPMQILEEMEKSMLTQCAGFNTLSSSIRNLSAVGSLADEMNKIGGVNAALMAIDQSLSGAAGKLANEVRTSRWLGFDGNSHLQDLMAESERSWTREIEKVRESCTAASSFTQMTEKYRQQMDDISSRMTASFDIARIAGSAGLAGALDRSISNIAKQYAEQFDGFDVRLRDLVKNMPTFDLATTVALAQFHGAEGLAKQIAALGLRPGDYLDVEITNNRDAYAQDQTGVHAPAVWRARRLDDLRQLVINLIATYLWVVILSSMVANPDMDSLNKRFDRVEDLVERLPQLLEPLVEDAVRRELGLDQASFVVKERTAQLRTEPRAGSRVVAIAMPNQILTLMEERGKWIRVEFYDYLAQDVKEGWVLRKYCQRIPSTHRTQSGVHRR